MVKEIFTTGQTAKICHVSPGTVKKWFDSGMLDGFRVPYSHARRISRSCLKKFLEDNDMPLDKLEECSKMGSIVFVGPESEGKNFAQLSISKQFTIEIAESGFDAGILVRSSHPDCIVIDFILGKEQALAIVRSLQKVSRYARMIVIGLLGGEDDISHCDVAIETFRKPFDMELLGTRIRSRIRRVRQRV